MSDSNLEIVKGDKKVMNAWAFYDWANSVYPLVITSAIFPIFYEGLTSTTVDGIQTDKVMFFGFEIINNFQCGFASPSADSIALSVNAEKLYNSSRKFSRC